MKNEENTEQDVHVGHNIACIRRIKGLKQETLAEMIGVTQQTMSHHEQQKTVNPDILKRISEALNIPRDVLLHSEKNSITYIYSAGTSGNNTPEADHTGMESGRNGEINDYILKMIGQMEQLIEQQNQKNQQFEKCITRLEKLIARQSEVKQQ